MSKAESAVRTSFTIIGVAIAWTFDIPITAFLTKTFPNISTFDAQLIAATLVVVPIFVFAGMVTRTIRNSGAV